MYESYVYVGVSIPSIPIPGQTRGASQLGEVIFLRNSMFSVLHNITFMFMLIRAFQFNSNDFWSRQNAELQGTCKYAKKDEHNMKRIEPLYGLIRGSGAKGHQESPGGGVVQESKSFGDGILLGWDIFNRNPFLKQGTCTYMYI